MYLNLGSSQGCYDGRVSTKLSVITDPRKIREYRKDLERRKLEANSVSPTKPARPALAQLLPSSKQKQARRANPFLVSPGDSNAAIALKFVQFIALGPASDNDIATNLGSAVLASKIAQLKQDYCQKYDRNNLFYHNDRFPTLERRLRKNKLGTPASAGDSDGDLDDIDHIDSMDDESPLPDLVGDHYLLKDKSYKELQPWDWLRYTPFERKLVVHNIHRALTRLGFSEAHPLRRKICDPQASLAVGSPSLAMASDDENRRSQLGGGILHMKKTTKKAATVSPKVLGKAALSSTKPPTASALRPLTSQTLAKRKFSLSLLSLSDDDKQTKKLKMELDTLPLSEEDDTPLLRRAATASPAAGDAKAKRMDYYNQLALKFRDKYKEYALLYNRLKNPASMSKAELKRQLLKLFELHTQLSGWKKKLWEYDRDIKNKLEIMGLSKHKKTSGTSANSTSRLSASTPAPSSRARFPLNY